MTRCTVYTVRSTELGQDPEARCPCCPVMVVSVIDIMMVDHGRSGFVMRPLSKEQTPFSKEPCLLNPLTLLGENPALKESRRLLRDTFL